MSMVEDARVEEDGRRGRRDEAAVKEERETKDGVLAREVRNAEVGEEERMYRALGVVERRIGTEMVLLSLL